MRFTPSTVEIGESKEGYQTLDGERQASYATQPGGGTKTDGAEWKRAMCDTFSGLKTRFSVLPLTTHLTTLFPCL